MMTIRMIAGDGLGRIGWPSPSSRSRGLRDSNARNGGDSGQGIDGGDRPGSGVRRGRRLRGLMSEGVFTSRKVGKKLM
jgi:hypothetical protein